MELQKNIKINADLSGAMIGVWLLWSAMTVQDPTIHLPGFGLLRKEWCTLNCFRTNQGYCSTCHRLWGLANSNICACGATQTMSAIVESCPLMKLDGGPNQMTNTWTG